MRTQKKLIEMVAAFIMESCSKIMLGRSSIFCLFQISDELIYIPTCASCDMYEGLLDLLVINSSSHLKLNSEPIFSIWYNFV